MKASKGDKVWINEGCGTAYAPVDGVLVTTAYVYAVEVDSWGKQQAHFSFVENGRMCRTRYQLIDGYSHDVFASPEEAEQALRVRFAEEGAKDRARRLRCTREAYPHFLPHIKIKADAEMRELEAAALRLDIVFKGSR
jgi:hypothetical protein